MNDFSDMLSKAKKVQEKMKEVQENLKKIEVKGVSGGNLVTVVLTGDHEIKSIYINPEAKNEKEEILVRYTNNRQSLIHTSCIID